MSTDPLSLLAGEDTSSSEDESVEEFTTEQSTDSISSSDKLPSPSTLFATVGKPSFLLTDSTDSKEIDWDHFVKNDVAEDKYSIHVTDDGSYAAIPPPASQDSDDRVYNSLSAAIVGTYNKGAVGQIAGGPVTYSSKERESSQQRREEPAAARGVKRASVSTPAAAEDEKSTESQNSKKVKTFRSKEKRKRDLGQSSRGKSYVEEEKRLLRQQFGTDAVMS